MKEKTQFVRVLIKTSVKKEVEPAVDLGMWDGQSTRIQIAD